jgi:hypothetical protein
MKLSGINIYKEKKICKTNRQILIELELHGIIGAP